MEKQLYKKYIDSVETTQIEYELDKLTEYGSWYQKKDKIIYISSRDEFGITDSWLEKIKKILGWDKIFFRVRNNVIEFHTLNK